MAKLALAAVLVAALVCGCGGGRHRRAPAARSTPRVLYRDGSSGRFLLDGGWAQRADPRNVGLGRGWQRRRAAGGFRPVALPNSFNAGGLTTRAFASRVEWYRDQFTVPRIPGTSGWRLRFEGVSGAASVFYRGRLVGTNRLSYLPFEVSLPGARPGRNEVVVRVDGRRAATPLPPASRPAGWWNYSGIVREVYLRRVAAFDLGDLRVIADPGSPARVRLDARARNTTRRPRRLSVSIVVTGPAGFERRLTSGGPLVPPGVSAPVKAHLKVPQARLWAPGHPWLYELRVTLPGGQVTQQEFGIRRFSVRSGRLYLNGRPLTLRGTSFHEITAAHGSALTPADRSLILSQLGELGADAAREHYPPHPALLEAFDRLGIVFWEQIPAWRLAGSELRPGALRPAALASLRRALLRDRNHACVAAFSVSNETLRGGSPEAGYIEAAKRLVRSLAPRALVAADTTLTPLARIPSFYSTLDAIGLDSYVGWYNGAPPGELGPDLDAARRLFPRQALVVTELGAEANRPGPSARKGTYGFQRRYLARELSIIGSRAYMSGALVWSLRDFPLRPGWSGGNPHPTPPINAKGLFREDGRPKPAEAVVRREFQQALSVSP